MGVHWGVYRLLPWRYLPKQGREREGLRLAISDARYNGNQGRLSFKHIRKLLHSSVRPARLKDHQQLPKIRWAGELLDTIGGFQVCEKWLKDRAGEKLAHSVIQHWQRMVVAVTKTQLRMDEIDDIIPSWPLL